MPQNVQFDCNKVVCCVRNPLDVFVSYASLSNTMNHTAKPEFDYETDFSDWWKWWVKLTTDKHRQYFDTLIRHSRDEHRAPLYIVRYEDLVANPQTELEGLFKFILDLDDIEGTNV